MHFSQPLAALLGLLTVLPVVYVVFFVAFVFGSALEALPRDVDAFRYLMVAHLSTMLLSIGLVGFYVVHLFKNDQLAGDKRTLWAIVLFMGNVFAMPVYWFLYVWRRPNRAARSV